MAKENCGQSGSSKLNPSDSEPKKPEQPVYPWHISLIEMRQMMLLTDTQCFTSGCGRQAVCFVPTCLPCMKKKSLTET